MRFLTDMCVDIRVAEWLRAQGHDVSHLREEGLSRLPNGLIFKKAFSENRTVITFDLDFSEIAALSRGQETNVILFRLHNTRYLHVIQRFSAILPELPEILKKKAVMTVEEFRMRVRYYESLAAKAK